MTQVATSTPFDNATNGFISDNVQEAIEEARYQQFFSTFDKVEAITYLDSGLRTQRISTISYSSVIYPAADLTKTIYWLDVGSINQRVEKEEISSLLISPLGLRKTYNYTLVGIRYQRDGFTLSLF